MMYLRILLMPQPPLWSRKRLFAWSPWVPLPVISHQCLHGQKRNIAPHIDLCSPEKALPHGRNVSEVTFQTDHGERVFESLQSLYGAEREAVGTTRRPLHCSMRLQKPTGFVTWLAHNKVELCCSRFRSALDSTQRPGRPF